METFTLATPIAQPSTTDFRVGSIHLQRWPQWAIRVVFVGTNNEVKQWTVEDQGRAQTLITALNKANLQTKSLERRCLEQAVADGALPAGSVTGTPD